MAQTCPWCGSTGTIQTERRPQAICVPYGPTVSFHETIDTCNACHEEGDFARLNDAAIVTARDESIRRSVPVMLDRLANQDWSMAAIERSLELPARTIARWKSGETSAAPVALLRMVTTYPWLLEVADSRFQPEVAKFTLVREAAGVLQTAMVDRNLACTDVTTTMTAPTECVVHLTVTQIHDELETVVDVRQLSDEQHAT